LDMAEHRVARGVSYVLRHGVADVLRHLSPMS
jgi:hypothetical protein